jgi:superfamily II DNA or RNA helicase
MATGLGKTTISAFVVEELLNMGYRGIFLCHENDILEQAEGTYRNIIGNHINYKTFYGSEKDWLADTAQMLFASFQSMNNHHGEWYKVFDKDHFDFMVVDESHHGQAATYSEVINYFDCKKLGMTATPDREDGKDIRDIFGEEVVNIPLEVGIVRGWLTHIEYHILSDGLSNRKLKAILSRVLKKKERVSVKQLNETIFISARTRQQKLIVEEFNEIKARTKGKKTMIFCENTSHADHIAEFFENAGVVHSKRPDSENHNALEKFRKDELQYLISVDKMNEGIDIPDVEVVVFLRATDSKRIWYQQTGRGARKLPGKDKLIVLDFVANIDRLLMIRELLDRIEREVVQDELLKGKLTKRIFNVSGEGFDFVFSDELIDLLKVLDVLRDGFYETWQEASEVARTLDIFTYKKYRKNYKKDPRLPSSPPQFYKDLPNWPVFFGRKQKSPYPTWQEASAAAQNIGIKTSTQYVKGHKKDERLYANPNIMYSDFPGWITFLNFEERESFKTWREASKVCIAAGVKNPKDYQKRYNKLSKGLRRSPRAHYKNFPGWIKFLGLPGAPKGWASKGQLSKKGISPRQINAAVQPFRKKHPKWFKMYSNIYCQIVEHYHPKLVVEIKKFHFGRKHAPKGWVSNQALASEQKVTSANMVDTAKRLGNKHPGWFGSFLGKNLKIIPYYHPVLVKRIRKDVASRKTPSKGWLNGAELKKLGISYYVLETYCKKFRSTKPGWFKLFLSKISKRLIEHYHPSLIKKMFKEETSKKKFAPRGWFTATSLAREEGTTWVIVNNFIKQFRKSKPKWFGRYLTKQRYYTEHLGPILVKRVRSEIAKKKIKAPEAWLSEPEMVKLLKISRFHIRRFVQPFRKKNKNWFKMFLSKKTNKLAEHFHPKLVALIKLQFSKN